MGYDVARRSTNPNLTADSSATAIAEPEEGLGPARIRGLAKPLGEDMVRVISRLLEAIPSTRTARQSSLDKWTSAESSSAS